MVLRKRYKDIVMKWNRVFKEDKSIMDIIVIDLFFIFFMIDYDWLFFYFESKMNNFHFPYIFVRKKLFLVTKLKKIKEKLVLTTWKYRENILKIGNPKLTLISELTTIFKGLY